jgi:hypothetical protein
MSTKREIRKARKHKRADHSGFEYSHREIRNLGKSPDPRRPAAGSRIFVDYPRK